MQEVDMTNLIALRNKHKEEFEKSHGVKLGFMSAFVRVSGRITRTVHLIIRCIIFCTVRCFFYRSLYPVTHSVRFHPPLLPLLCLSILYQ